MFTEYILGMTPSGTAMELEAAGSYETGRTRIITFLSHRREDLKS